MHIVVVTFNYPTPGVLYSGTFVKKQVEALRDLGLRVDVFHVYYTHKWPISCIARIPPMEAVREADGRGNLYIRCPVRVVPRLLLAPDWLYGLFHREASRQLLDVVEELKPDLLHFHFARSMGMGYRAMARHPEVPRVLTSHGLCTRESRHRRIYRGIVRRGFRMADKVIFVSEKLRRDAVDLRLSEGNFEVVGNGIDGKIVRGKDQYWAPGCGRPFRISAVGNLIPLKGHDDTLRAVAMLTERGHDVRLDIVGEGDEYARLSQLIGKLDLGDRVTLHGSLVNEETLKVVYQSDVHCLPSWNEGFGVVYIEAMVLSVPTIACRGQGIEPLLTESEAGFLVDAHSPGQIAGTLERLITEDGLVALLGERSRQFIAAGHTLQKVCHRIVGVYESAIEAAHRRNDDGVPGSE